MDNMYYDFARNVKNGLCEEINGRVFFEIYKDIDTVVFKSYFKDFEYSYAVNNISDRIYSGETSDTIVTEFISGYRKAIKKAFFKTEEHKRRDAMAMIGGAL